MYNVQACFSGTVIKNTDQSLYCSVFIFLIIFNDKKKRSLNYNLHMISRVKWIIIKYSTNQWFHQWFKRLYYLCIFLIFEIKIMSLNTKKKKRKKNPLTKSNKERKGPVSYCSWFSPKRGLFTGSQDPSFAALLWMLKAAQVFHTREMKQRYKIGLSYAPSLFLAFLCMKSSPTPQTC